MLHVVDVKYVNDYILWVSFDDGTEGNINLESHLNGPVFEPLKQKDIFAKVRLDDEIATTVWPNGADFAPEFLKSNIVGI